MGGRVEQAFRDRGLWNVRPRYRNFNIGRDLTERAPYFGATVVLGSSPLLSGQPLVVLTAREYRPGSLVVQLQDTHGKPVRGHVLGRFAGVFKEDLLALAGSSDEKGLVRFDGLQEEELKLAAYPAGSTLPNIGSSATPLPGDKELIGHSVFPEHRVKPALNTSARVMLRARPVGYLRVRLRPARGRRVGEYKIEWDERSALPRCASRDNAGPGEFLIGPFVEGKTRLIVTSLDQGREMIWASKEVEVRSSRVTRAELITSATPRPAPPTAISRFRDELDDELSGVDRLPVRGSVFLPDSKTPARYASVARFLPDTHIREGWTDARGQIHFRGIRSSLHSPENDSPGSPDSPVLVAWLPSTHGATVAPIPTAKGKVVPEVKLVLPLSLNVSGKVTVGSKPVSGRKSEFRVRAAFEGKGKLNDLLSVEVSADADGCFELSGLTPGRYRVQAAMDGIWLSSSVLLTVKAGDKPKPLTLAIGEPGPASEIRLVDRRGKPILDRTLSVVRPAGPLTDRLWPARLAADGAGLIRLPPLETGTHKLRIEGVAKEQSLVVPSLADSHGRPVELRVVVE
jgi:hypothetical protein